jgi:hypothetical protein
MKAAAELIHVGMFPLGAISVSLWANPLVVGGQFCTDGRPRNVRQDPRAGEPPAIVVGLREQDFDDVVSTLLHEVFELQCTLAGHRLDRAPNYGGSSDAYVFLLRHPDLSECMGCVGMFVSRALPLLRKAYNAAMRGWK